MADPTPLHFNTSTRSQAARTFVLLAFLVFLLCPSATSHAKERAQYAVELKEQLVQKILPYWYDTAIDQKNGGYLLSDDAARKAPPATEKQLVTQSRMIWGFSHAHLKGLGDGKHDYLKAAAQGYRFLLEHFLDGQDGGYFWSTDVAGKPIDERKIVYGESFVIYGLVEYYRASRGAKVVGRGAEDQPHLFLPGAGGPGRVSSPFRLAADHGAVERWSVLWPQR